MRSAAETFRPRAGEASTADVRAATRPRCRVPSWWSLVALAALMALAAPVRAQDADPTDPAFSLSSDRIFDPAAEAPPAVTVAFERLDHLDFRVYRVRDPQAFFLGLRDPHYLGSPRHDVAQEPTAIERIASWKARWRARIIDFFRLQVSPDYRRARRAAAQQDAIVQRRTVEYKQFAQLPLLNDDQVVATWRELLPRTRSTDVRTIPLDLETPGVYLVEAVHSHLRAFTIVVVSSLGLVNKTAPGQVLLFAVDRRTGAPRDGCQSSVIVNQQVAASGTTDADGVFTAELGSAEADALVALVRCGDDTVVADPGAYFLRQSRQSLRGYIYTDRPVYRPGHTLHVKAVLRWMRSGEPRPFDRQQVEVVVSDPEDKVLLRQQRPVDNFGAVSTSVTLPASAALGDYTITVNSDEDRATGSFSVEEYRKPEFEVSVTAPQRYYVQGTQATLRVQARYYFGQPVAHGRVKYVTYSSTYWSPWRSFEADADDISDYQSSYFGDQETEAEAALDENGEALIPVDLPDGQTEDLSIRVEARVTDASGREVAGRTTLVATQGPVVVATRADRWVFAPGAPATFLARVTDYEGRPQPNVPVRLTLGHRKADDGSYGNEDPASLVRVASATLTTDVEGRVQWPVTLPSESRQLVMVAEVTAGGRTVRGRTYVWMPERGEGIDTDAETRVELVADKASYAPGETATFVVRGGDGAAAILVSKEYASTMWHAVRRLPPGATLQVPVTEQDLGDVWVSVAFVRDDGLFTAEKRLRVPAVQRRVQVNVEAAQLVSRPREPGVFTIRTLDAGGQPVSAQLSVGVVDEAVYGVQQDTTPDPVSFFYRRSYSSVYTNYSRYYAFVGHAGTQVLQLAQRRRPLSLADFKADRPARPPVRKEFPDAIHWVADLVTDATGTATVRVNYPDSLTSWRLTARAVTQDTRLGAAILRTTTTKDVIVRVATPRFLTEGDTVDVPVVAHNFLEQGASFNVSLTATGVSAAPATPTAPMTVQIPARGEHVSHWAFSAGQVGTATFTGTASAPADGDAMAMSLPVLPYGLAREQGTSGTLADTAELTTSVSVLESSNPAARTIEVTLAPSMAGSLIGALDFLTGYPYGCTEQTLSSFLPNLTVMRALAAAGVAPTERTALANRFAVSGLRRLYDLQHPEGGFGWWKTDEDHPFMTAYALFGYLESADAGLEVEHDRLQRAATATMRLYREYPRMIPDLKAYLAWVLARAGARSEHLLSVTDRAWDAAAVRNELWEARGRMGAHGRALLLMTLDLANDPRATTLASELIGAAQTRGDLAWWTATSDPLLDDYADTSAEATALAVQALVARDPNQPVVERAVRWLLASRGSGAYWYSTKQTALALYALVAFMKARGEAAAAFDVDVVVNGTKVATQAFTPADYTAATPIRVTAPANAGANEVRLVKRGGGRLYWTAAARFFDTRESLEPQGSRTLAISRRYFSVSPVQVHGRLVYRETPFAGTARPGDLILVRISVAGAGDWRYLVIEDPLPAGTEAIVNQEAYELENPEPWWSFGRGRREYRDARVVQFQDRLAGGRIDYGYLVKVVTPGRFRAMPAQVLPMYVPGVWASSTLQSVIVETPAPEGGAPSGQAAAEGGAR